VRVRDHERRAEQRWREQRELLLQAATVLRHEAVQGAYSGYRGRDAFLAIAAGWEAIAQGRDGMADMLRACRRIVDGPDGPNDPRGGRGPALTKGW
jgi:hypothetical protein